MQKISEMERGKIITRKKLKKELPDFSNGDISEVIQEMKTKGLIGSTVTKGKYVVLEASNIPSKGAKSHEGDEGGDDEAEKPGKAKEGSISLGAGEHKEVETNMQSVLQQDDAGYFPNEINHSLSNLAHLEAGVRTIREELTGNIRGLLKKAADDIQEIFGRYGFLIE